MNKNERNGRLAKFKGFVKKAGKVLVLAIVATGIALSSVFGLVGCGNTNNHGGQTIVPTPTPTPIVMTVQEAFEKYPANVKNFVSGIVDEVKELYDEDDVLFTAYDLEDKEDTKLDDLAVYMSVKGEGTERVFMTHSCTFGAVEAKDLADGRAELTDLVIETTVEKYDAREKQNDDAFLQSYYGNSYDVVVKAYQKEVIPDEPVVQEDIQIHDVETLLAEYNAKAKAFGDPFAKAIMKKYESEDAIFCGYSFDDESEDGKVSGMHITIATKSGETERTYSTYKVIFDPIKLDSIADGSYSISNAKSALESETTYDAKEKQDDQTFLDNLYGQDDFTYVEYENETFENQTEDPENPGDPENPSDPENLTIGQIITDYSAIVNGNLSTHYDKILKKQFKSSYNEYKDNVTSYQWDLGAVNENNEIQNAKITIAWENNNNSEIYVYNVDFNAPISLNDLTNSTQMATTTASYNKVYSFSYNSSIQGTRTELVNAILQAAITDGFDYQNAEIIFKENSASTDANLGTVRSFTLIVKNDTGIKQINFSIATANTDEALVGKINSGKYKTNDYLDCTTYSSNMLDEYIVAAESEND